MATYSANYDDCDNGGGGAEAVIFGLILLVILGLSIYGGFLWLNDLYVKNLETESNSIQVESSIYTNTSHAEENHTSAEVVSIRNCINGSGTIKGDFGLSQSDKKRVSVCEISPGEFGLWFYKVGKFADKHEITAFIKNNINTFDELLNYLKSTGYNIP